MSADKTPIPEVQSGFGERYEINTKAPLADFSTPGGQAFMVVDKENAERTLYAVVQNNGIAVRNDVYKSLSSSMISGMICPVARGVMNVSLDGRSQQRFVTIFERPTGGPLISSDGKPNPRLNPMLIKKNIALALLKVAVAVDKAGFAHRRILPTNVYFASPTSTDVVVGECCTTPAGVRCPMGAEPLELAFADETARGEGNTSADFYQIGVTLQCLNFGKLLYAGRDRNSFLTARVNQTSYWSMAGGQDIPGTLGTLVRGLMADEVEERWHAEEMVSWFEGISNSKRTTMKAWSLSRPTVFEGVSYADRRLLADAFARNPQKAAAFLRSLDFTKWIQASLRDEVYSERVEKALNVAADKSVGSTARSEMRLVSRVCMFLHPNGPIRYKDVSVNHDAIHLGLAAAFAEGKKSLITSYSELFDMKLLSSLLEIAGRLNPTLASSFNVLKNLIPFATSNQLGKGMERVLYEMNPGIPCLSPRFDNIFVASMKQLMTSLERLAGKGGGSNILFDRHVAAFCARHGGSLDREFNQLAAAQKDQPKFNILALDFFSMLQQRYKLDKLPNLTNKLVENLKPALKDLKDKKKREEVSNLLDKAKKSGDLSKVSSSVNLLQIQAEDRREFAAAVSEMAFIERERKRLTRKIVFQDPEAQLKGLKGARNLSAVTAIGLAVVLML
ncbi:hypothetical protein [Kordiimonas sediminis]|uniref:hypothetical protein n=1 Tax=Kordiimonas sediminis TaxID=1735581 RepID=UPI0017496025|nr:hypothetical protein [Kordiimonas sediminis]